MLVASCRPDRPQPTEVSAFPLSAHRLLWMLVTTYLYLGTMEYCKKNTNFHCIIMRKCTKIERNIIRYLCFVKTQYFYQILDFRDFAYFLCYLLLLFIPFYHFLFPFITCLFKCSYDTVCDPTSHQYAAASFQMIKCH